MMKNMYSLSDECWDLVSAEMKRTGQKPEAILNDAVHKAYLPITPSLRVEAQYILNEHFEHRSDPEETKKSISRGINGLVKCHIQDNSVLLPIFSRYKFGADAPSGPIDGNDWVREQFDQVVKLLRQRVPYYVPSASGYDGLVRDIFANWQSIWDEDVVYQVLSTIVFSQEPVEPFDWFEGIDFLRRIEIAAWLQWCKE